MNKHLQTVFDTIQNSDDLSPEQKELLIKALKQADKELEIVSFKLDRTEKVKRTTAILLEETIEELEQKRKDVEEANDALKKSLSELKAAQAQLVQSEKMASLGELTAGIAHEIQNPLNFVNNFSDVSTELIDEAIEELNSSPLKEDNLDEAKDILTDLKNNLEKIAHHGGRADSIVKGMLQHSRTSSGEKIPTDINELADEYLRLAYYGLRAKDSTFNAAFETHFDPNLPKVNVIPQDIGRVLLNLINNAFQAVHEKGLALSKGTPLFTPVPERREGAGGKGEQNRDISPPAPLDPIASAEQLQRSRKGMPAHNIESVLTDYQPKVSLTTKHLSNSSTAEASAKEVASITIKDNGPGIPDSIIDKIFQPFFTTKPTGQGTGLGLSLAYDIVKAHGGTLEVESKEGTGTQFIIHLPIR